MLSLKTSILAIDNIAFCYVFQVEATDLDIGSNANITYSISSGNLGNVFSIDEITGQIKVAGGLDRETLNTYKLLVTATDGNDKTSYFVTY